MWVSVVGVFCIVVFFFKHKTAYEMRISDWSSDVCSSDLLDGVGDPVDLGDEVARVRDGDAVLLGDLGRDGRRSLAHGPAGGRGGDQHPAQIGRASCRERVCQYG